MDWKEIGNLSLYTDAEQERAKRDHIALNAPPVDHTQLPRDILARLQPHYSDWSLQSGKINFRELRASDTIKLFEKSGNDWISVNAFGTGVVLGKNAYALSRRSLRKSGKGGGSGPGYTSGSFNGATQNKPEEQLVPAVFITSPSNGSAIKLTDKKYLTTAFEQHTFSANETVQSVTKQLTGIENASAILNYNNPPFSERRLPQEGDQVRVAVGQALRLKGHVKNSSNVTVTWQGPDNNSGSKTLSVGRGTPNQDIDWELKLNDAKPGNYLVNAVASSASHQSEFSLVEDNVVINQQLDWVKVKATYEDRWKTPMAGAPFKLYINDALVKEDKLKDFADVGLTAGQVPKTADEKAAYELLGTYELKDVQPGDVRVELVTEPGSEQSIANLRDGIVSTLDGSYRELVDSMKDYQELWDKYGAFSLHIGYYKGFADGAVEWGKDLFDADSWKQFGSDLADGFWKAVDAAGEAWDGAVDKIEDAYENRHVVTDRAWWASQFDEAQDAVKQSYTEIQQGVKDAGEFIEQSADKAVAIYNARDAIMALPEHIANGDVEKVESFIDNELRSIDPELADELRYSENWQGTLELLQDGESLSAALVYLGLFTSAVPAPFYAHAVGKAGFYIIIEVVLIIIGALLGGVGAAARIGVIAARFTAMAARAGGTTLKIRNAKRSINAFAGMLQSFGDVARDMNKLRAKLLLARRSHKKTGKTNQSLEEKRKNEKRNGKCRLCGSTKHHTPAPKRGVLEYI